jgi:hypothetical protein
VKTMRLLNGIKNLWMICTKSFSFSIFSEYSSHRFLGFVHPGTKFLGLRCVSSPQGFTP